MELEIAVAELVRVPFVCHPGAILFVPAHGQAVVNACQSLGIGVLGIDGFRRKEEGIQPDLDNSCDFSSLYTTLLWENFQKQSCREATSFLQMLVPDIDLVEFVLTKE